MGIPPDRNEARGGAWFVASASAGRALAAPLLAGAIRMPQLSSTDELSWKESSRFGGPLVALKKRPAKKGASSRTKSKYTYLHYRFASQGARDQQEIPAKEPQLAPTGISLGYPEYLEDQVPFEGTPCQIPC